MSVYLDTSVLIPLQIEEETSPAVQAWLRSNRDPLVIGRLAEGEVASAMSRLVRMAALSVEAARAMLAIFEQWVDDVALRIDNEPADILHAGQLVRTPFPKLLMPDAIHLATCLRLDLTLVTLDRDLADNAVARGISVVVPAYSVERKI